MDDLQEKQKKTVEAPAETVPLPWLMLALAAIFDVIGLFPFINLLSEPLAGLIFGLWQKSYAPKTDPLMTFFISKVIDIASLGLLPSNIGVVVYAYLKKKSDAALSAASGPITDKK